jgi:hypothetical protein
MMSVSIDTRSGSVASEPRLLFDWRGPPGAPGIPNYDVAPDGRFLMVDSADEPRLVMHFVENSSAKLRQMTSSKP